MDLIKNYLINGALPDSKEEARKVRMNSARYSVIEQHLYRRSFSRPYLRCVAPSEAKEILSRIYDDECKNHSGGRSLAHKVFTQGYFWSNMAREAKEYVRRCDKCKRHANVPHQPPEDLTTMTSPWPFVRWGMDQVGPLPAVASNKKYVLLATDYFTKWIEAEAYTSITHAQVKSFIWNNIVCRFGLPESIIMDNATNFDNQQPLEKFFRKHGINKICQILPSGQRPSRNN